MASSFVQLFGYLVSLAGMILTIVICARPNWRVNDLDGEVIESIRRSSGLWSRVRVSFKEKCLTLCSARTTTPATGNATSTTRSSSDCRLLSRSLVRASASPLLSKESQVWQPSLAWSARISLLRMKLPIQVSHPNSILQFLIAAVCRGRKRRGQKKNHAGRRRLHRLRRRLAVRGSELLRGNGAPGVQRDKHDANEQHERRHARHKHATPSRRKVT